MISADKPLKFLFIVQGEGRGHATQAIRLKEMLMERRHEVGSVLTGKNPQRQLPDSLIAEFDGKAIFFRSPNFLRSENRRGIKILPSILHNLFRAPVYTRSIFQIKKHIQNENPDIILNFYDLIGGIAWYLSKSKAKYFAISHHYLFESPHFEKPGNFWLQKKLLKLHNQIVSLRSTKKIALSFDLQQGFADTAVLPPLIRKDLVKSKSVAGDFILVYLLNEGLAVDLLPIFTKYRNREFYLYMQKGIDPGIFPSNVTLKDIHYQNFATDLIQCAALISTTGFESVCEAAYLGKPVFLIPTENHYEQHGNRKDAIRAGMAMDYRDFDENAIKQKDASSFKNWCSLAEKLYIELLEDSPKN